MARGLGVIACRPSEQCCESRQFCCGSGFRFSKFRIRIRIESDPKSIFFFFLSFLYLLKLIQDFYSKIILYKKNTAILHMFCSLRIRIRIFSGSESGWLKSPGSTRLSLRDPFELTAKFNKLEKGVLWDGKIRSCKNYIV